MKKLYWIGILFLILLVFSTPVSAEPMIQEPGYSVEVFITGLTIPHDLIFNDNGDLFVTETDLARVSMIMVLPDGTAGDVSVYGSDIPDAEGVTLDASDVLFVSDWDTVYKVIDGTSIPFVSGFADAEGLAFDQSGDLFVSDDVEGGVRISKIDVLEDGSAGEIMAFAIIPTEGNAADIAFDSNGNLFVADNEDEIWKLEILPNGSLKDVSPFVSGLFTPYGLEFDTEGNLFVGSSASGNIWKVDPFGNANLFASGFTTAPGLAFDANGTLFVAEEFEGRISKILSVEERIYLEVMGCDWWSDMLVVGDQIAFQHGIGFGDYETAVAERSGHEAYFLLDGEPLGPVYYEGLTEHSPGFYGDRARVNWDVKPGEHVIQSYWSHENEEYPGDTCVFKAGTADTAWVPYYFGNFEAKLASEHIVLIKDVRDPGYYDHIWRDGAKFDNSVPERWCEDGYISAETFPYALHIEFGEVDMIWESASYCRYPAGWIDAH